MPEPASTRLALIGIDGATDAIADGDDAINAIIARLEAVGAGFQQGTSRPAASGALEGYFYIHTGTGLLSYCTGSVWLDFQPYDADLAAIAALSLSNGQVVGKAAGVFAGVNPPGFEIGYDQITTNVNVLSTTESTGTTVITAASHTFDGSPVIAEFFSPRVAVDHITMTLSLFEGSTQIGRLALVDSDPADTSDIGHPVVARFRFTPTAGAHTYKVTAFRSSAQDATVAAGSGGTGAHVPAYLRFTKV